MEYPIYSIKVQYTIDGDLEAEERAGWWPSDPGTGRKWDSTVGHDRMYREDPGLAEVERWTREEFWVKRLKEKPDDSISDVQFIIKLSHSETWCLSWFSHWTFDAEQTDVEVLDSFTAYVRRYEHLQSPWPGNKPPEGYRCLMGAEDRWRWCGSADGSNDHEQRTPAPCRCKHCKEQGVIRIGH